MTLAAPMDLTEWFNDRIVDFLVLTPTSTSPQPVHVLNGFFHSVLDGRRSFKPAVDFVASKTGGEWAVGNTELRERSPLKLPKDDAELEQARRAISSLVAADRAVFSAAASFQLAHLGLVTSDRTHHHLGRLAGRLTLLEPSGRTAIEAVVARLSHPQANPHWSVESVLSEVGSDPGWTVKDSDDGVWWATDHRCMTLASHLHDLLRRALRLSAEAVDPLLGLQVLAIASTWAGLVVYAQVPTLMRGQSLVALLCEAGTPGSLASVRAASAAVIDALDGNFQEWICQEIATELTALFGDQIPSGTSALAWLRETKARKFAGGAELRQEQLEEVYSAWAQDHDPTMALAHTLQDMLTISMGNKAKDWFAAIGRHCGFVGPRRGHPARLRVEVALAPTLVLAGFNDDDESAIPFSEWSHRMADRYGVVFGPHQLSRSMVPRASEEQLEQNQRETTALLASLGLARRYSDGVTEVLNPFKIWTRHG